MTNDEKQAAILLGNCTFRPGSYDKRFVTYVYQLTKSTLPVELTDRQRRTLWKLFYTYRRQIIGPGRPSVLVHHLLSVAKPIYDGERARRPVSLDDQDKLAKWNEASR